MEYSMPYDFETHTHNFAAWTASRAVQRNFTTTDNITAAIEASSLRVDCQNPGILWSPSVFDEHHEKWASAIQDNLTKPYCTYGRAAKIIAVYIKTAVVLPNKGEGGLARYAHPPIDRILLTNLKKEKIVDTVERWTELEQKTYFDLINHLRNKGFLPFWMIEEYWKAGKAKKSKRTY